MYTNEDLNNAVNKGIFTQESVEAFRKHIADTHNSPSVDEENFKLISGFNDIFVVVTSLLLLLSVSWIIPENLYSSFVITLLSWGLAEFFVKIRKMPLPAIVLFITFVGSFFIGIGKVINAYPFFMNISENTLMLSTIITAFAAYIHWKRFAVPVTVAVGIATMIVFSLSLLISYIDTITHIRDAIDYAPYLILLFGVITFFIAMVWDASDTKRISNNSDVAFWLHLLAAPLIVHSTFTLLGVFDSQSGIEIIFAIVGFYILLSILSIIINRRAFMVSSLLYVLYATNTLFSTYGMSNNSFAITGIFIGFSLLLLSGFWSTARSFLLRFMPQFIKDKVPLAH